jgi:hypothetical protein
MNRRIVVGLTTIMALGFALQNNPATSQQKSLKDQLVGTWAVVSWVQTNKDGSKYERFGSNPKGVNMFSPDGHFSLVFIRPDLPKIASNDPAKPSPRRPMRSLSDRSAISGHIRSMKRARRFRCKSKALRSPISSA